jgi:hypothetical protein
MRFRGKNEKGELVEIPIRLRRDESHRNIYAHGASGGFLANYHYRIDFYRDEFPPTEGTIIENNEVVPGSIAEITRTVLTSIYLTPSFAKELRNWLDKNIAKMEAEYGEIQMPKSDEEEDEKAEEAAAKIKKEA